MNASRGLGRSAAHLAHELEVSLGGIGLSLAEYRILGELERGGSGNGELARALGVTPPTVTTVVDGLVRRDFVTRERIARDRRRVALALTPTGRLVLRRADEVADRHLSDLIGTATRADAQLHLRCLAATTPLCDLPRGAPSSSRSPRDRSGLARGSANGRSGQGVGGTSSADDPESARVQGTAVKGTASPPSPTGSVPD